MSNTIFKSIVDNSNDGIIIFKDNKPKYTNKKANEILKSLNIKINSDFFKNATEIIKKDNDYYRINVINLNNSEKIIEFKEVTDEIILNTKNIFFDFILDNINDGIILTDTEGNIIEYNKASEEFEGLDKNYVLGKKSTEIYDVSEEESEILQVIKTKERILDINGNFQTIKGKEVMLVSNYYPVFKNKYFLGVCAITTDYTKIQNLLDRTIELQSKIKKNDISSTVKYSFDNIVGSSLIIKKAINEAKKASETDSSVLVIGDTGTGKEMFVQSIHRGSLRRREPFVPVNCAAIPENLLESLLFGTIKGSFTGAENKPGLIEQAGKGTLYLDELNSMPINLQAKLLRVIQEKKVRRLGSRIMTDVKCRFIASINEDPNYCIENSKLRKDLFYRLAVITIDIPNLIERIDDIEVLAKYFIDKYNKKYKGNVKKVSDTLINIFKKYTWPGNVREFQYVIESAINMDKNIEEISHEHLPNYLYKKFLGVKSSLVSTNIEKKVFLNEILTQTEKEAVSKSLLENNGNVTKAAECLGISRQNLHYRIRKLNIK